MAIIFKKSDIRFEMRDSKLPEFKWHTSQRLGAIANSKHLQFDIRSLDPGKFSFPYHYHEASEELFMIVSGEATLRTPDGFKKVTAGDIAFFEEGPTSAHQLYNHGNDPCVYLDIRVAFGIDITEYPDSQKINIFPQRKIYKNLAKADYLEGEENVRDKWPQEIVGDE